MALTELLHSRIQTPNGNKLTITQSFFAPKGEFSETGSGWTITDVPERGDQYLNGTGWTFKPVCTNVAIDARSEAFPGLGTVVATYEVFQPFGAYSGTTYEIEGSRRNVDSDATTAVRIFASTDGTTDIPAKDDFFPGESAPHGRRCNAVHTTRDALPGVFLVTCTYVGHETRSVLTGEASDQFSIYEIRRRASGGNNIFASTLRVLSIPTSLGPFTTPNYGDPLIGSSPQVFVTEKEDRLDTERLNRLSTITYTTQTNQQWMMTHQNQFRKFTSPAITSYARWKDLNGDRMFGKDETFPRSHYKIIKGENINFRPKENVIARGIVDSTTKELLEGFKANYGFVNSSAMTNLGIGKEQGFYLGTSFTPITGATAPLWEAQITFLEHPIESWNTQCEVNLYEVQKIWVNFDPECETLCSQYAGWVESLVVLNPYGTRDEPGYAALAATANFGDIDGLVSG